MLRMDEHWFITDDEEGGATRPWPIGRADLDPFYDRVALMLRPVPYPIEWEAYGDTPKTRAVFTAADEVGLSPFLPDLAVAFGNDGDRPEAGEPIREAQPNLHGKTRSTCRMCGECDIGCNYGSKNTLDYTYLSEAQRAGAELWTGCEVTSLAPRPGGGYSLGYRSHGDGAAMTGTVTAERVILAAGALGSTNLLLRHRSELPAMSPALGTRFSGNGDLLTLAVGTSRRADGRTEPLVVEANRGPVITSAVRIPDATEGGIGRGFYSEDGGFPELAAWIIHALESPGPVARATGRTSQLPGPAPFVSR